MLTSKSTQGCRLKATEKVLIRAVGQTGLTSGRVDLGTVSVGSSAKGSYVKRKGHYRRQRGTQAVTTR